MFFEPFTKLGTVEGFMAFWTTSVGELMVAATGLIFALILFSYMKRKNIFSIKTMTYSAVCIALSIILSNVKLFRMPQGGTVSLCSMLFITLIGYWFGTYAGFLAGFVAGIFQLLFDPYVIHPLQLIMDYPLAFSMLGFSGLFRNKKYGLYTGYIFGVFGRFMVSSISGFIFFSDYINEPIASLIYTLQYNISYMGAEAFITLIVIGIPAFAAAIQLIKNNQDLRT